MGNLSPEKGNDRHEVMRQSEAKQDETPSSVTNLRMEALTGILSSREDSLGKLPVPSLKLCTPLPAHPNALGGAICLCYLQGSRGSWASQTIRGSLNPC